MMDSTGALKLEEVPKRMLVIGGGIIGLEMATVYAALGSKITVVEMMDRLMLGADPDLVKPLRKLIDKRYENILLNTKVTAIKATKKQLTAHFEGGTRRPRRSSTGCWWPWAAPNSDRWIWKPPACRPTIAALSTWTNSCAPTWPHIFAIGDIVGQPMLAHKATHEGKVAAEVIAGEKSAFDARVIPSVAYTDPEVAWVGITEEQAKAQGLKVEGAGSPGPPAAAPCRWTGTKA